MNGWVPKPMVDSLRCKPAAERRAAWNINLLNACGRAVCIAGLPAMAREETIVPEFHDRPHQEVTAAFPNLTTTTPPALLGLTVAFHREGTKPIAGGIVAGKIRIKSFFAALTLRRGDQSNQRKVA
jgi:hypothetical protein